MPNIGISVGGQFVQLPGVYVTENITPTTPINQLATGPLVFIAAGYGGKPLTPINFTDGNALKAAMRGAPSADLVDFMINPSTELYGAQFITYINVVNNTQSSTSILSGSPGSAVIALTSVDYGVPSNLLNYSMANGSLGGKFFTITDGYSAITYSHDNLGIPFELAYTGTASGVTFSVTTLDNVASQFIINSPNLGESVTIQFNTTTLQTVQQLCGYLDGTGFYSANVLSQGNLPLTYLDAVSGVVLPIPNGGQDQYVNVTATLGDIVYFVNNTPSPIATAVVPPGVISASGIVPNNAAVVYFSGATNAVPTTLDYANAFNVALSVPAWVVFADSNDSAVRALGAQHSYDASEPVNGTWRRFVTGSSLGDSVATTISNARGLNEYMATYVFPGIQRTNLLTGQNQTYDGLHAAAAIAGMMCGNSVATSLTNKTLLGNGVELLLTNQQLALLENSGVLAINYPNSTRLPTVLLDTTTWLNDSNPENMFNQQVACRFALAYYLVNGLQPYVGQIASTFTITQATNATKKILNAILYNGIGGTGILNNWDTNSLILTYTGDTQSLRVQVSVVFVGQYVFIPVTVVVNPLNLVSTGTSVTTTT